jgi:hypothetical protein
MRHELYSEIVGLIEKIATMVYNALDIIGTMLTQKRGNLAGNRYTTFTVMGPMPSATLD